MWSTVIHIWVLLLQQSYREGTSAFVTKGKKAVFHLCKALTRLKDMTKQTFKKKRKKQQIFDIKIQPILTYASEFWRTVRLDDIEKVHMMACKRFFRCSSENTEQDGVR